MSQLLLCVVAQLTVQLMCNRFHVYILHYETGCVNMLLVIFLKPSNKETAFIGKITMKAVLYFSAVPEADADLRIVNSHELQFVGMPALFRLFVSGGNFTERHRNS